MAVNADQTNQLEAKHLILRLNAQQFPVNKSVWIKEVSIDVANCANFTTLIDFWHKKLKNDHFIEFDVQRAVFLYPEQVVFSDLKVNWLHVRCENYFELRSSLSVQKHELFISNLIGLATFWTKMIRSFRRKFNGYNYNVEVKLNECEFIIRVNEYLLNVNVKKSSLQASNMPALVKNSQFRINVGLLVDVIRNEKLATVDVEIDKKTIDAQFKMIVHQKHSKHYVNMLLPHIVKVMYSTSLDLIIIPEVSLSIAHDKECNYEMLAELSSIRVSVNPTIRINCDQMRWLQCCRVCDFDFKL